MHAMIKINTARFYKKDGAVRPTGYIAERVKRLDNTSVADAVGMQVGDCCTKLPGERQRACLPQRTVLGAVLLQSAAARILE